MLRSLFWFALFIAATLGFTVLFEHGPSNFQENAKKEYDYLSAMIDAKPEKKKDEASQIPGNPK